MHLLPYENIAVEAGVSVRTIWREVHRGKLKSYKVNGRSLIDAGAARDYIADKAAARQAGQ
jgi:hypothetical protein